MGLTHSFPPIFNQANGPALCTYSKMRVRTRSSSQRRPPAATTRRATKKKTESKIKLRVRVLKPNNVKVKVPPNLNQIQNAAAYAYANANTNTKTPWYNSFTKGDPVYNSYMANEWGYEKRGDAALFEKLCLEGAQSGLSWRTILHKRKAYRTAFHEFDIELVSQMTCSDVDCILNNSEHNNSGHAKDRVVRHRGKLMSVIHNAKQLKTMKERIDGFDGYTNFTEYLWGFVKDQPILNGWSGPNDVPSKTEESEAMSQALKRCGFKFIGPTTCYSLMQSCGFVIDHPVDSDEWKASFERIQKRKGGFQDRR